MTEGEEIAVSSPRFLFFHWSLALVRPPGDDLRRSA